ncbi:2EXR domain-containing protein [Fusarium sp. Ph1]|nr:2EXR domain-containing protein [Fusarium sp. Ph1]
MAAVPKFDRLPGDPRSSIENCLKSVYLDSFDPRKFIYRWFRLLRRHMVQHDHEVEYSFMIAFGGRHYGCSPRKGELNPEIANRDAALSWVRRKDEKWRQNLRDSRKKEEEEVIEQLPHELELPIRPAIGFWLFPIEALGPVPTIPPSPARIPRIPWGEVSVPDRKPDQKIDLSGHKPQLCLSYLP